MLVLTRRRDEVIMLGDDIKIVVLEIDSDRVRIGIEAPLNTRILRAELMTEVRNVNCEATQTNLGFLHDLCQANAQKDKKKNDKQDCHPPSNPDR